VEKEEEEEEKEEEEPTAMETENAQGPERRHRRRPHGL